MAIDCSSEAFSPSPLGHLKNPQGKVLSCVDAGSLIEKRHPECPHDWDTSAESVWNYKGFADSANTKTISHPNFVLHGSGNATTLLKA